MLNPCIEDVFKIPELQIKYCQLCGSLSLHKYSITHIIITGRLLNG